MTINHDRPCPFINIPVKLIPSLKLKKGNLWSGTERSPWPLSKYKNKQRGEKKRNPIPKPTARFSKAHQPGYFLWLPSYYGVRLGDEIYRTFFVSSAEFKMLTVLGSRAWHSGFTTPCQGSILPTALQSQVLACGLPPPLPSQWLLRVLLCHSIALTPGRVCSCSTWLFLGGANPPWLRIALTAQGQEFLCHQQRVNTKVHFSKVRIQAMLLYQGTSPYTLMLHLYV